MGAETVKYRNPTVKKLTRRRRCALFAHLSSASREAIFH